jgi:hypothetical protein
MSMLSSASWLNSHRATKVPLCNCDMWFRARLIAAYKRTIGDIDHPDKDGMLAEIDL